MCNSTLIKSNCVHRNTFRHPNSINRSKRSMPCAWRVNDINLLPLEPHYPLARSHIIIQGSSAPVISGRVSEFARLYSLATEKTPDAPCRLRCNTDTSLIIEINLWKKDETNIIVEICKRRGCSIEFHRVKRLLSKAVLGKKCTVASRIQNTARMDFVTDRHPSPSELHAVLKSSQNAFDLISKREQVKDIINGLQFLTFLTDPTKTNRIFASRVSNTILTGVTILGQKTKGREALYDHVLRRNGNATVHCYALKVLGNALELVSKKKQTEGALDLWWNIVPSLILDMEMAKNDPHAACGAMRCLRLLYTMQAAQCSSMGNDMNLDMRNLVKITAQAYSFGKVNHVALEQEAREIIKMLNPSLTASATK